MDEEDLINRLDRYSSNVQHAFSQLPEDLQGQTREVVTHAKRYYDDAFHFKAKDLIVTALISLSYAEGLLDALKLLGLVEFSWSDRSNSLRFKT